MKYFKKKISSFLVFSMLFSLIPQATFAQQNTHTFNSEVKVTEEGIFIKGNFFDKKEFLELLKSSEVISYENSSNQGIAPALAGVYFVPGVGEIAITATGAVLVAGVAISTGSWAYKQVVNYFKEHTKNKRKSTSDKHTKKRPGRQNEKKKTKEGWKPRNPK